MTSPSRNHYPPKTMNKTIFTSYLRLRLLLLTVIFLGLVLYPTSWVLAEKATLVIKGSGVWQAPHYTDRQTTEAEIPIQLPKNDGPIEGKGTYRIVGKTTLPSMPTYTMSGPIVLRGHLSKGFLIFSWPDFYYQGKLMPKETVTPLRLKAKDGSEVVQKYTNPQIDGEGRTIYRLEMKEKSEEWEVFLTGYEIDEMDPYWKKARHLRGAIRFDWKLRGRFTIAKEKGVRTYAGGVITIADVGLSNLYEPIHSWLTKPLRCRGCRDVKSLTGKFLKGILEGNAVSFYWGSKRPSVEVDAKIVVPCTPMPDCARWGKRLYESKEFLSRVNYVDIPLMDGATVPGKVVDSEDLRWINYNYLLRRLK